MPRRGQKISRSRVGSFFLSLFILRILAGSRLSVRTKVLKSYSLFPSSTIVKRTKESALQPVAMQCLKHSYFPKRYTQERKPPSLRPLPSHRIHWTRRHNRRRRNRSRLRRLLPLHNRPINPQKRKTLPISIALPSTHHVLIIPLGRHSRIPRHLHRRNPTNSSILDRKLISVDTGRDPEETFGVVFGFDLRQFLVVWSPELGFPGGLVAGCLKHKMISFHFSPFSLLLMAERRYLWNLPH
jgi:hypothetical protein